MALYAGLPLIDAKIYSPSATFLRQGGGRLSHLWLKEKFLQPAYLENSPLQTWQSEGGSAIQQG
jgi:hypothetical protein